MTRTRLAHFVIGVEGLALMRQWQQQPMAARDRFRELIRLVGEADDGPLALELELPELDVASGYAEWAPTYDAFPNPLIAIEEPAVRALIDDTPVGRALDAACGTGRHAAYLRGRGHEVIGVDVSPEMLERARARVPDGDFRVGDLESLPVESHSVDLAVCALALDHVPQLEPALRELARVVRPGGRVIVSDFHPFNLVLGGGALFPKADGTFAFVRSYRHDLSEYVGAFRASGLEVRGCLEPAWGAREAEWIGGPLFALAPEAFRSAYVGVPGALIWDLARP